MTSAMVAGLAFYCFVQGITPGPANLCSLATVLRDGKAAALRQWWGLTAGFYVVSFAAVFVAWSARQLIGEAIPLLSAIGALYVLWLAWSIAAPRGKAHKEVSAGSTAVAGFLLQIANVKVLVLCLTALFSYVLPLVGGFPGLLAAGFFLPVIGTACNLVWIYAGSLLQGCYESHRKLVDGIMALSLVLCAAGMVLPLF